MTERQFGSTYGNQLGRNDRHVGLSRNVRTKGMEWKTNGYNIGRVRHVVR